MRTLSCLFLIVFSFCTPKLFAQQPKDLNQVVNGLHDYMEVRPQEKIHIHFDKPFYSVGDTIWFKVYLVNALGNRLSAISKIVHWDMNTPDGKTKHLVLPVNAGMAAAQIVLTDSLYQAGDYPIRAYTQWMRNNSEDYFFNYTLRVGDVLHFKANASANFSEDSKGLTAELIYNSAAGTPLPSQEVSYKLKNGEKVLFLGKIKTDLSGKAGIVFPQDKLPKNGIFILETSSTMKSGAVMNNRFAAYTNKNKISLDFFPEGGVLVSGLRSKVAFKALAKDGLGVPVKGFVENDKGEQVAVFETTHAGMGVFALLPQVDNVYTAVLADGQRYVLPKALTNGFILSVNPSDNDELIVRISRSAGLENQTEVRLVLQANGEVQQAIKLPMNNASIAFNIPKAKMAEGINQITLFSADHQPLAERLVFVQQNQVDAFLESDKPEYNTRDLVKLTFDNGANVIGGYSVAVVKADKMTLPEEKQLSIYANLLLSSDLKGHIEDPNYYFTNNDAQKNRELDILLLSQGWRRFNWKEVLLGQNALPNYKAEQGLDLSGKIVTLLTGKPVPNAKIKLLANKQMLFLDTVSNTVGRFSFKDLQLSDSVEVILRATGVKDRNNVKIVLDEIDKIAPFIFKEKITPLSFSADTAMKNYLSQTSSLFDEMEKTGKIIQGTTLKTIEIVTKKKAPEIKGSVYPFAAAPPDYVIEPDELQEISSLENYLRGRFMGVQVVGDKLFKPLGGQMVILLNGTQIESLAGINPRALTGIEIIRGTIISANMSTFLMLNANTALYGSPSNGIVFLTMSGIPDKFIKPDRPSGFLQQSVAGYTYPREFFVPNYKIQEDAPKIDFRSTLFWKSDIVTAEDGKTTFSFYASDEPGKYRVTLEGIGANGQISRKISYFVVNN